MHYILASDLIKELSKLPHDTEITSVSLGYCGDSYYFTLSGRHCNKIAEIPLQYKPNEGS